MSKLLVKQRCYRSEKRRKDNLKLFWIHIDVLLIKAERKVDLQICILY